MADQQQADRIGELRDHEADNVPFGQRGDGRDGDETRDPDGALPEPLVRSRTGSGVESSDEEGEDNKQRSDVLWRRREQSGHPYQPMGTGDCGQRGDEIATDQRCDYDRFPVPIDEPEIAVSSAMGAESPGACRMQVQTLVSHAVSCSLRCVEVASPSRPPVICRRYSAAIPRRLCSLATR